MCTSITYHTKDHYFGRNLDLEYSYHESVAVTPRNMPLPFRYVDTIGHHFAMIGMAYVLDGYPLYYEASNECGLSIAGLNFPGNAVYHEYDPCKKNIAPFELIPMLLGTCEDLEDVLYTIEDIQLVNEQYNEHLPLQPLHWMIADVKDRCIVLESVDDGLRIYPNSVGVMTNNPPFDKQLDRLNDYMYLSPEPVQNNFSSELVFGHYSRGMGAMGLPGDLSSASRFVKAAFTRNNSVSAYTESASISQFFHILGAVEQQRGCVHLGDGSYEITIYSCCCNMEKGIYYYKTYDNSQITAVCMRREDLSGHEVISYPIVEGQHINYVN